ncbi:MAG: hypothetical protein WAM78_06720 [Candidatus Sulfotelmatobacter sp.]
MKQRFTALNIFVALLVVAGMTCAAFAQDSSDTLPAHPRYARLTPHLRSDVGTPAAALTTWNGQFSYGGTIYKYNMVGKRPSTGASLTVPTFIIPVVLQYTSGGTTTTFTPYTKQSNGATALANTINSPIFQDMDWVSPEGTDLGTTQYEDAFQRGNFWSQVKTATGYHVLLGTPTVTATLKLTVPAGDGKVGSEFGVKVGLADINWFDAQLEAFITAHPAIRTNTFPIFITYDAYLTESGECCVGGYHNSMGTTGAPQAYAHFTYIGKTGTFAQDVSALSHEAGEWLDDPLVVNTNGNPVACGVLEVGDPEEGFNEDGAAYGAFPYTLSGFTYHLQDLVYLEYFGAPKTTSVDGGKESFHDNPFGLGICNNGG